MGWLFSNVSPIDEEPLRCMSESQSGRLSMEMVLSSCQIVQGEA